MAPLDRKLDKLSARIARMEVKLAQLKKAKQRLIGEMAKSGPITIPATPSSSSSSSSSSDDEEEKEKPKDEATAVKTEQIIVTAPDGMKADTAQGGTEEPEDPEEPLANAAEPAPEPVGAPPAAPELRAPPRTRGRLHIFSPGECRRCAYFAVYQKHMIGGSCHRYGATNCVAVKGARCA